MKIYFRLLDVRYEGMYADGTVFVAKPAEISRSGPPSGGRGPPFGEGGRDGGQPRPNDMRNSETETSCENTDGKRRKACVTSNYTNSSYDRFCAAIHRFVQLINLHCFISSHIYSVDDAIELLTYM